MIYFVIESFHGVEASTLYLFFECLDVEAAVLLAKQDLVEAVQLILQLLVFLFALFLHHFFEFAALFFPHLVPSLQFLWCRLELRLPWSLEHMILFIDCVIFQCILSRASTAVAVALGSDLGVLFYLLSLIGSV